MNISKIVNSQKDYFATGATKDFKFRMKMLTTLKKSIKANEDALIKALKKDLNKSEFEAFATEVGLVYKEISLVQKKFKASMLKKKVKNSITTIFGKSYILKEPHGVSLIIVPWNYPFQLGLSPLIGAIMGGNTAIVKPSEFTPATSKVIAKLIKEVFPPEYITVVEGGVPETTELLQQELDFVFFTGSPQVGKIIMTACAKQLIPCVLELGGKSPVIWEKVNNKNIDKYARRLAFGKFLNAGQTCIAPDYLLIQEDEYESFIEVFKTTITNMFDMKNFTNIINNNHFERLKKYLKDGEVIYGGKDVKGLHMEPTLIKVTDFNKPIMKDEIFGPIFPIITYKALDEVEPILKANKNPLAFYVFSNDTKYAQKLVGKYDFGGGCINDVIKHITNKNIPFGGKGTSGIGRYGGMNSLDTFTYDKGIVDQASFEMKKSYPNHPGALKLTRKHFK